MGSKKTNAFNVFILENIDIVIALAIIVAVMFLLVGRFLLAEGTIMFGDFVPTLELRQYFRVNYPLWSNRNSFNYVGSMRLPYLIIFYFPFYIANAPAEVFFKFMIVSMFVISGFSMYVTTRHFLNKVHADRKTVLLFSTISSLFYAFNPWVMDRVYHIFLLVTYSFLPLILLISIRIFHEEKIDFKRVLALVLLCSIASTSPHSLFFISLLIVSLYTYFLLLNRKQFVPKTKNLALFIILYVLVNAFWVMPLANYSFSTGSLHPDYIIQLDDVNMLSRNSNLFNVFRLVAYWWPKVSHSFDVPFFSTFWVFASLAVPAVCFLASIFHKKNSLITYFSLLSVVLIFLAGGTRSPLPGFYEWLCFDAPVLSAFGWLFRDPNKWTLLLPLAYSTLLAFVCLGISGLIRRFKRAFFRKATVLAFVFLLFSLVFVYITPSATNYFGGPFKPVKVPSEIYSVNSWLGNDSASYQVLWMPSYAEYGATWVYNGWSGAFELDSSAKPTFDSYSKHCRGYFNYFNATLSENRSNYAAGYLNPLNVRYIIFHNDSVLVNGSDLFQSLKHQNDLELVKQNGTIYVFENKEWSESVFQPYGKVMAVGGGFDEFVSLNALKVLDLSHFSVVFLDQNLPGSSVNSDMFVLSGDLLSDCLPLFLNESVVVAPFDFSRRHNPAECWSKASLYDLAGGPFHLYLEQNNVTCWDFDYDKGVIFTWAPSVKLDIPFSIASTDDYRLFFRVFENAAGGEVAVCLDGLLVGKVDTRSQPEGFVWRDVGILRDLTLGSHVLTLENIDGFNSVNLIAVMPAQKALEMSQILENRFQSRDLLYVFEAESDMLRENASVSTGYSGEASNGEFVELISGSNVSTNVELLCNGNYSLAFRSAGNMLLKIDNKSYEVSSELFDWKILSPVNLSSGKHQVEASSLSIDEPAKLDVLWLLKLDEDNWSGNTSAQVLSVKEYDPTRFVVELDVNEPFMLCFSSIYDPAWSASFNGRTVSSMRVFGVANGFWINTIGKIIVAVEFQPQRWFYIGSVVSSTSLFICAAVMFYGWWRRKRKQDGYGLRGRRNVFGFFWLFHYNFYLYVCNKYTCYCENSSDNS